MRKYVFLIAILGLFSCENKAQPEKELSYKERVELWKDTMSSNSILSNDIDFINDSILKGKFKLDISQYENEDCYPMMKKKKDVYRDYAELEFKDLGDLNGDKKNDSVFILEPLNWCEENSGESYYFTDNNIPRIESECFCSALEFIFNLGDIDNDGGNELAEYRTACTSRFKAVTFWTLKNGKWKEIETFGYLNENGQYDIFEDFYKMYKKLGKGKFKFLEISDQRANGDLVMGWRTVKMK